MRVRCDPVDGVFERTSHRVLADHVIEDLRPPFEGQYLVGHLSL